MIGTDQIVIDGLWHSYYVQSQIKSNGSAIELVRDMHGSIATDKAKAVDPGTN